MNLHSDMCCAPCAPTTNSMVSLGCFSLVVKPCHNTACSNGEGSGNEEIPAYDNIALEFDEVVTMPYRFRGKQVYGKLINCGALSGTSKQIPHGILDADWYQMSDSFSYAQSGNTTTPLNISDLDGGAEQTDMWMDNEKIYYASGIGRSGYFGVVFVLFTKKDA